MSTLSFLRPARLVCVAALVLLSGCAADGIHLIGRPAPETRFTLLAGDYVPLKAYRGKTVVVAFWAQWCTSSGPAIARLQKFSDEMDRSDVVFLAASLDEVKDVGKLKDRIVFQDLDDLEHAFSGNAGSDEAFIAFEGQRLPYFIVIDPTGVIRAAGNSDSIVTDYFAAPAAS